MKLLLLSLISFTLLSSCTLGSDPINPPTSGAVVGNQITSGSTQFAQPVGVSGLRN